MYRFEARKEERIKLTITNVKIKGRNCRTRQNIDTNRFHCYGNTTATLRVYDVPWIDVPPVPRDCICSNDIDSNANTGEPDILPFTYISISQISELRFEVTKMNSLDDFDTLFFEGMVKFIRMPICMKNRRRMGPSGEILFNSRSKSTEQVINFLQFYFT